MTRRDAHRGETEIVVFGRHPVLEAIRSQGADVCEVKIVKGRSTSDRRALRHEVVSAGIAIEEVSRDEMSRYTGAPRHDQGFAAKLRLLRVIEVDAFVEVSKGRAARKPSRLIALDGVTNSQNVGMVVRSVVGAGLDGILWPLVDQPWINGLVVRAAAGSIFECPIVRCESLPTGLATLQAAGFSCVGLDASGLKTGRKFVFIRKLSLEWIPKRGLPAPNQSSGNVPLLVCGCPAPAYFDKAHFRIIDVVSHPIRTNK